MGVRGLHSAIQVKAKAQDFLIDTAVNAKSHDVLIDTANFVFALDMHVNCMKPPIASSWPNFCEYIHRVEAVLDRIRQTSRTCDARLVFVGDYQLADKSRKAIHQNRREQRHKHVNDLVSDLVNDNARPADLTSPQSFTATTCRLITTFIKRHIAETDSDVAWIDGTVGQEADEWIARVYHSGRFARDQLVVSSDTDFLMSACTVISPSSFIEAFVLADPQFPADTARDEDSLRDYFVPDIIVPAMRLKMKSPACSLIKHREYLAVVSVLIGNDYTRGLDKQHYEMLRSIADRAGCPESIEHAVKAGLTLHELLQTEEYWEDARETLLDAIAATFATYGLSEHVDAMLDSSNSTHKSLIDKIVKRASHSLDMDHVWRQVNKGVEKSTEDEYKAALQCETVGRLVDMNTWPNPALYRELFTHEGHISTTELMMNMAFESPEACISSLVKRFTLSENAYFTKKEVELIVRLMRPLTAKEMEPELKDMKALKSIVAQWTDHSKLGGMKIKDSVKGLMKPFMTHKLTYDGSSEAAIHYFIFLILKLIFRLRLIPTSCPTDEEGQKERKFIMSLEKVWYIGREEDWSDKPLDYLYNDMILLNAIVHCAPLSVMTDDLGARSSALLEDGAATRYFGMVRSFVNDSVRVYRQHADAKAVANAKSAADANAINEGDENIDRIGKPGLVITGSDGQRTYKKMDHMPNRDEEFGDPACMTSIPSKEHAVWLKVLMDGMVGLTRTMGVDHTIYGILKSMDVRRLHITMRQAAAAISCVRDVTQPEGSSVGGCQVLPIEERHSDIVSTINDHRVTIIEATTGSGKSTRVPIFIRDAINAQINAAASPPAEPTSPSTPPPPARILCSQPRRSAARNIARRVKDEHWKDVPWHKCPVGYIVGNPGKHTKTTTGEESRQNPDASILFVTAGWLLNKLTESLSYLDQFTHIILDEVHERDTDTDLTCRQVLAALKSSQNETTRLVLMSATVNIELYEQYFAKLASIAPNPTVCKIKIDRNALAREVCTCDDVTHPELTKRAECEKSMHEVNKCFTDRAADKLLRDKKLQTAWSHAICQVIISRATGTVDHSLSPEGDAILVFLPGIFIIESIMDDIIGHTKISNSKVRCFAFHSDVEHVNEMFLPPPPGMTHVILATNIAETSLTIPNVTTVIDTGIAKKYVGDKDGNLILRPKWIVQASAEQRAGRTGRTCPGIVVRLYPEWWFNDVMLKHPESEIRSLPLESVILKCLLIADGHTTPKDIIEGLLEQPRDTRIDWAIVNCYNYGLVTEPDNATTRITDLGRAAVRLGLSPACAVLINSALGRHLPDSLIRSAVLAVAMVSERTYLPFVKSSWRYTPFPQDFGRTATQREGLHHSDTPTNRDHGIVDHSDFTVIARYVENWISTGRLKPSRSKRGDMPEKDRKLLRGVVEDGFDRFMVTVASIARDVINSYPDQHHGKKLADVLAPLHIHSAPRPSKMFYTERDGVLFATLLMTSLRKIDHIVAQPAYTLPTQSGSVSYAPSAKMIKYLKSPKTVKEMLKTPFLCLEPKEPIHIPAVSNDTKTFDSLSEYLESAIEMMLQTASDHTHDKCHHQVAIITIDTKDGDKTVSTKYAVFNIADKAAEPLAKILTAHEPLEFVTGSLARLTHITSFNRGMFKDIVLPPVKDALLYRDRKKCEFKGTPPEPADTKMPLHKNKPDHTCHTIPAKWVNVTQFKLVGTRNVTPGIHSVMVRPFLHSPPKGRGFSIPLAVTAVGFGGRVTNWCDSVVGVFAPECVTVLMMIAFNISAPKVILVVDGQDYIVQVMVDGQEYTPDRLIVDDVYRLAEIVKELGGESGKWAKLLEKLLADVNERQRRDTAKGDTTKVTVTRDHTGSAIPLMVIERPADTSRQEPEWECSQVTKSQPPPRVRSVPDPVRDRLKYV